MAFFFSICCFCLSSVACRFTQNLFRPLHNLLSPTNNSPGKNFLRAAQMNMNFATWGHLMMSILPRYSSFTTFSSSLTATPDLFTNSTPRSTVKEHQTSTPLPRLELSGALGGPGEGPVGLKGALFWLFCSDAPVFRLSFEEGRAPPTSPGITTATNNTSPLMLDNMVK